MGSTSELSVQWTADGVTTNETLGTVDFNDEMTEPTIVWGAAGSSLDFGYSVRRVGNKQYRLTLTCYPVEVQVDALPWMQPAQVEIDQPERRRRGADSHRCTGLRGRVQLWQFLRTESV